MVKIIQIVLSDILRNKLVIAYTILLAAVSWSVLLLENNSSKGILSLLNIILLIVPIVCIVFSAIYLYNSSEFIELMVSQPITRKRIWLSILSGLSLSLVLAFVIGAGIPALLYADTMLGLLLIGMGSCITLVFVAMASLTAMLFRDKAKGIGLAIVIWLFYAILFDGILLFLLFQLSDYPIEQAMSFIIMLSPLDIARIMIVLQLDTSALLGYTGAVFKQFWGTEWGITIAFLVLLLWSVLPFYMSLRIFKHKDL